MLLFEKWDTIIFDCDGVLIDSNGLKILAMQEALAEQTEFRRSDIRLCINEFRQGFGKSRFHHIENFLRYARVEDEGVDDLRARLLRAFGEKVENLYTTAPIIPGVESLLASLSTKTTFVVSGSEHGQLQRVLTEKNLSRYFQGVYGSPATKVDILNTLLTNLDSERAVFVGDSSADFEAAKTVGISFVYFSPFSNEKVKMSELKKKYQFCELESLLK